MSELKYSHSFTIFWIYLIHVKIFPNLWVIYHVWTLKNQTTDNVYFIREPSKGVRSLKCKMLILSECDIPRETTLTAVGYSRPRIRQTTVMGYDRQWIRQHIDTGMSDMAILQITIMRTECSIVSSPRAMPTRNISTMLFKATLSPLNNQQSSKLPWTVVLVYNNICNLEFFPNFLTGWF